jgi:hypothetical protein
VSGVLDVVHHLGFFLSVSQHFGKWYCLRQYVEEGQEKGPIVLGPFKIASLQTVPPEQDSSPACFEPEG